jgi:hypothetical protein
MFENMKKYIKENLIELIFVGILALILIYTLLLNPILGKCDNGDFGRLQKFAGLSDVSNNYEEIYDGFFHEKYRTNFLFYLAPWGSDWIFGAVIVKIAVGIHFIFNFFGAKLFDIRIQTVIYIFLFLISIYYILKYKGFSTIHKVVLGLFIIVFFTDINYIAYFNSFFGEAGTIVFFFLTLGTYLNLISKENYDARSLKIFFASSLGFLTSKTQQLPLLLFMIIIYGALYFYSSDKNQKILIRKLSIFVVVFCTIVYLSIGDFTNKNNIYQAVFTGVLKDSKNPEKDLEELGINKKFASLAGTGFYAKDLAFQPLGKEMREEFYPKASRGKILIYFAKHPDRAYEKIKKSAENSYAFEKVNKSYFKKGMFSSNKILNETRINLIEAFPSIHRNIFIFTGFSLIYFVLCMYHLKKVKTRNVRLLILMLLFILVSGSSQLVLPVLGSGEADFGKHLFLINLAYDIMVGVALLYVVNAVSKSIKVIRNKINNRKKHSIQRLDNLG